MSSAGEMPCFSTMPVYEQTGVLFLHMPCVRAEPDMESSPREQSRALFLHTPCALAQAAHYLTTACGVNPSG